MFLAVLMTTIQLYFDYQVEYALLEKKISIIQKSSLPAISSAVWTGDKKLILNQLQNILNLSDIQYLEVNEKDGIVVSAGKPVTGHFFSRYFDIGYTHPRTNESMLLATFRVDINLEEMYGRLFNKGWLIFGTKTIEIFVIGALIYLIFYLLVGRHLNDLAIQAKELVPDRADAVITLKRSEKKGIHHYDELDDLVHAMNAMSYTIHKQMEALRQSEEKYRVLFESFPLGITVSDEKGKIIELNTVAEKILKMQKNECRERSIQDAEWNILKLDGKPMPPEEFAAVKALHTGEKVDNAELGLVHEDGTVTWFNVTAAPIPLDGYGVAIAYSDVSDKKKTRDRLKSSLEEKDVLLRELYHRTKNTLQVVRSMLILQAGSMSESREVQMLVSEMERRIMAIALVHQKLYQSQDLSHIQMQSYLGDLSHFIFQSFGKAGQNVRLDLEIEPVLLLLDTVIPCGLIVNELLTNALKYAFPEDSPGTVVVGLKRRAAGDLLLWVFDDGVGLPAGFDYRNQKTLGLQTVISIVEHQMQGRITYTGEQGVSCRIEFSDKLYDKRV